MTRLATIVAAVLAFALFASAAVAQTADPKFPFAGTLVKKAPVFIPREDRQPVVVILDEGTSVQVRGRQGVWYRVIFSTPQGDQVGLMAPHDIRVDEDAPILPDIGDDTPVVSQRGFIEFRGFGFPQTAANDTTRVLGSTLVRQEASLTPARWLQVTAGVDLRDSSNGEVTDGWDVDVHDRGTLRPRAAVRRLSMALTSRYFSLDLGKQFIRWGRADILSPVDRFAPRDYINVLDSEFLPVVGARTQVRAGSESVEFVLVPRMTPSRLPLMGQRWTAMPAELAGFTIEDGGAEIPERSQHGVRWSHAGRFEVGLSYFDGFNHLPTIEAVPDPGTGVVTLTRRYDALRTYGGEALIPTPMLILKAEAAWFTSPTSTSEEYVLYIVEAERQVGEWLFNVGYAGDVVTEARAETSFGAERGVADTFIGRAAYTIDPRRSVALEGAVRRTRRGYFVRGEFSQTLGRHWRLTVAAAGIGGEASDFLGQYQRNSYAAAMLRFSY